MESRLATATIPDYDGINDGWSYEDLKMYFNEIIDCPFTVAVCAFLSNVEGLGDFFDKHPFFDFEAYLILAVYGIEEGFVFDPNTEEYSRLKADVEYFLTGKCDAWVMNKSDLSVIKSDASKVWNVYFGELI